MLLLGIARLHLADRPPLGEVGRRLGSRLPHGALGSHRRRHRRPPLPRPHELEPGSCDPCALVRVRGHLGRRARHLGRDPVRRARRRLGGAPVGQQRPADDGCRRAGAPARAGHRPLRQLLEPGALRPADDAAVGPQDRPGAPERDPGEVPGRGRLPADVPLRVPLGPASASASCSGSTGASRSSGRRSSRSTSSGTRPSARSRRSSGSTRPTTSCTCGSTSGSRSGSGSSRSPSSSGGSSSTTRPRSRIRRRSSSGGSHRAAHGRPQGPRPVTALRSAA